MQSLATKEQIALKLNAQETLDFIISIEELVKKERSVGEALADYFINGQESNPFHDSVLEIKAAQVDASNFENSKIESIKFSGRVDDSDFEINLLPESLISLGALEDFKVDIINQGLKLNLVIMDYEHFKQYREENSVAEVFAQIMDGKLFLSFPANEALMLLLTQEEATTEQLSQFIHSDFFTTEDSHIVITKENFVVEDKEILLAILARPLSEDAQKVLVNRFLVANPGYPDVVLASVLNETWDQFESFQAFKEKIHQRNVIISMETYTPIQRISLELNEMTESKALIEFMKSREVKHQEIIDYIFRDDALPEIGDIILAKKEFIITDPILCFRVIDVPVIAEQPEVVEVLTKRYEAWGSKDRQIELAVEFQNYHKAAKTIPSDVDSLSSLIEKSTVLRGWVKNIDPEVKRGVFENFQAIEDCEFDSQGFPLVAEHKINYVLMQSISRMTAPADLLLFVHNDENLPVDKVYNILAHPNCPNSLLMSYAKDRFFFMFLLKNPALPQEVIEEMVKNINQVSVGDDTLSKIIAHPNCPPELAEILRTGPAGYEQKIITTEDGEWLAEQTRLLMFYPLNWAHPFEVSGMKKHDYLSLIMGNPNTPIYTLNQLLEYYQGFETDPDEFCTSLRKKLLDRENCPQSLIYKMSKASEKPVRMQLINSRHFKAEDVVREMLISAIEDLKEEMGEQKLSSPKILLGEMNDELKTIMANDSKAQNLVVEQVLGEIKRDIEAAIDVRYFKPLYKIITENKPIMQVFELSEQDKGELLGLLRNKYKEIPRMGGRA